MRNTKAFVDPSKDEFEPVHNMTLQQLETLASRQQDQIRAQAQLLLAKENRLNILRKQQDEGFVIVKNGQRQYPVNGGDPNRLMTLRQKIEQQEMKLRRLRMLRGQVDQTKASNAALTSDLESIRMLFNEKEKELSLAVSRVDELTNQLEDLRLLRSQRNTDKMGREETKNSAHALQLEALRRELMYRQQVTSSQASRVAHQRSLLSQKQDEMNRVDRRIAELQQRLHRRKMLNDGLAHQLQSGQQQQHQQQNQQRSLGRPQTTKIAAVEPFNVVSRDDMAVAAAEREREERARSGSNSERDFPMNKSDPKYQTLPYNTKFPPMVVHSSTASAKVTKGQATEVKIAPVSPPKPTTSTPSVSSVSNVILSTSRTYTSVYSPDENHHDSDDHHINQSRPYLPPKPMSVPPRLSPSRTPESVEEAVSILKSKSEDLIKFEEPKMSSIVEVTSTSGASNGELSVQPAQAQQQQQNQQSQEDGKVSYEVAPPTSVHISINRRIEMPPEAMFPENASPPSDLVPSSTQSPVEKQDSNNNRDVDGANYESTTGGQDTTDDAGKPRDRFPEEFFIDEEGNLQVKDDTKTKSALKGVGNGNSGKLTRRVSFDPLALLLDAALEGEVELVKKCAIQAPAAANASNDEGITALHNAVCAGHLDIVEFLVEFGCDVNAQDSDGWTPLHCAASCNNLPMVQYLVEKGACVFATTISDAETAAQKCEEDEDGYDSCSEYLYNVQEKLGIWNGGVVYSLYDFDGSQPDELSFRDADRMVVVRKGDDLEREWWWSNLDGTEGYVPRNLLGLYPRVKSAKTNSNPNSNANAMDEENDETTKERQEHRSL